MVDRNETVTLVVSKGAKKITVPSGIVNSSLETAKDTIKKQVLKLRLYMNTVTEVLMWLFHVHHQKEHLFQRTVLLL